MKIQLLLALFGVLAAASSAQAPNAQTPAQPGAILFRDNCARCHGANLEGSKKGPNLAEIHTKKHWTDEKIANRILNGAGKMPPFRDTLSSDQIQQLVAYLLTENRSSPSPVAQ